MGNPCNAWGRAWLARVCVEMALPGGKGKAGLEEAGLGETVPIVQGGDHDCLHEGSDGSKRMGPRNQEVTGPGNQ